MIDTSSKRKPVKKGVSKSEKKPLKVPKVGTKRTRKSKKGEEEDEDEEGGSEEGEESIVKKRKVSKGKAQVVKGEKKKKAPKKPTVFKKGKWNPDIEVLDIDKYKFDKSNELFLECCIRCN